MFLYIHDTKLKRCVKIYDSIEKEELHEQLSPKWGKRMPQSVQIETSSEMRGHELHLSTGGTASGTHSPVILVIQTIKHQTVRDHASTVPEPNRYPESSAVVFSFLGILRHSDAAMATSDPANASISRRAYFYALPYPLPPSTPVPYSLGLPSKNPLDLPEKPLEPTHTLVLTSTRKQFVDIRVYKPIRSGQPELPNEGGPRERYVALEIFTVG